MPYRLIIGILYGGDYHERVQTGLPKQRHKNVTKERFRAGSGYY